jgi:flagellar biogenesis protein FliO
MNAPFSLVMILAVVIGGLARGDELVPLPPLPEDVVIDPAVVPAALETGRPLAGPLPLGAAPPAAGSAAARPLATGPLGDWTVLTAIAAAFCLLGVYRFQQTRRRGRTLPADVFEVLGEASLGGPQAVRVVRFGPRTLLLGVSATGCQTLATLDDPQVTDRIVAACLGERPPRPASAARSAPRPAAAGFKRPAPGEEAA